MPLEEAFDSRALSSLNSFSYNFRRFLAGRGLEIGFLPSSHSMNVAICSPKMLGSGPVGRVSEKGEGFRRSFT